MTRSKGIYPPALTGMRSTHDVAYEVAHAMAWQGQKPTEYATLDEHYDLVIVVVGLSDLAAAHLFRERAGADKEDPDPRQPR